jgi:hypothetical protein
MTRVKRCSLQIYFVRSTPINENLSERAERESERSFRVKIYFPGRCLKQRKFASLLEDSLSVLISLSFNIISTRIMKSDIAYGFNSPENDLFGFLHCAFFNREL